jgi:hypothetical protein
VDVVSAEDGNEVRISFRWPEAIVLLEQLSRFSEGGELIALHEAEKRVLWDLCCLLESSVGHEAFGADWPEVLAKARASVALG